MITKDMLIIDALQQGDPDKLANVLQESGMHCLHCMLAHGETIEEAAAVTGVNAREMVKKITHSRCGTKTTNGGSLNIHTV